MRACLHVFFAVTVVYLFSSCKKESFTSDPTLRLRSSVDTLHFDTVFTTAGSTTQAFKIFNQNDKGITISSVRLAGGASSPFKINVDGTPGPVAAGIDVRPNDSAYVFVSVSINPTTANLPFIIRDSIEINYNGNKTFVQLDAFGQNAHFFRSKKITGAESWNNDLPYVLLGRLTVDTNATLTINKGCRVFIHADAPFIVHGTLNVRGEKWDSTRVVFTGDRLDLPYKNFPASYPGLIFSDVSKNNAISYGIIRNAYQGIALINPQIGGGTKLSLNETIIENAYDAGIISVNSSITAQNLLVANCGKNLLLIGGGDYNFNHTTVASFSNNYLQHRDPVLLLSNVTSNTSPPNPLTAVFRNSIFWGDAGGLVKDEVVVVKNGTSPFSVSFENVLWRVQNAPANAGISNATNNQDPKFDSINVNKNSYSFRLAAGSPAINKGVVSSVNIDLDGLPRPVGLPDLGAYERQ